MEDSLRCAGNIFIHLVLSVAKNFTNQVWSDQVWRKESIDLFSFLGKVYENLINKRLNEAINKRGRLQKSKIALDREDLQLMPQKKSQTYF